ncbi:MAG: antibiotic biosynthesis monooxygenase [Sphingobacteriales bacterium]|nr:MAG: antibiotic biosynthesis monooxygenase [Sphingobacteriales bacterium]
MILRIVKLVFEADQVATFQKIFEEKRNAIRHFEGCTHLELWQDRNDPCTFFTYSWWLSEEALDDYRNSPFFGSLWKTLKLMFAQKAEAWSVNVIRWPETVPAIEA